MISRQFLGMAYRGRTYKGAWYVIDTVLYVESPHGSRNAELENITDSQVLAELLFRQLIRGLPQPANTVAGAASAFSEARPKHPSRKALTATAGQQQTCGSHAGRR
jgi:hypothetical protein